MKKILIATLGNRDMQLSVESNFPTKFYDYFEKGGSDTGANLIVKKTGGGFLENSKAVFEHYDDLQDKVSFPMVETYLEKLGEKPELIVLISTKQEPLDSQDCHYVVLFLQRWLEQRGHKVDYYPLECSPVDFPELVNVFSMFYDDYRDCQLYVGNSGGTPDMRAASYAAGFFRNIQFITIQARSRQVNLTNYAAQEKLVLQHVVENMLANFDYSGLFLLPIDDNKIKSLAQYALARLSLDFETANALAENTGDGSLILPEILEIREKEKEVWVSAKIKFHQNAWGDYLWRLFLIQDNLWIPIVEKKMGGAVIFNKKSKYAEWNSLLDKNPGLKIFLESQVVGIRKLDFSKPVKVVFDHIVKFYEQNGELALDPNLPFYTNLDKIMTASLRDLRNGVAHNYKGINRSIIETELKTNSGLNIEEFHQKLATHTGVPENSFGIFDYLNMQILDCFS